MKLLVTGASGFLGNYVVAEALRRGYSVRVVLRPSSDISCSTWLTHPSLEICKVDFSDPDELLSAFANVDAVIHLVASKSSNFEEAYQTTVVTTNLILSAMAQARVWRLVIASSFSVYDYGFLEELQCLDETCPLETEAGLRDVYAQTKLFQENAVREFTSLPLAAVTVLRPGMIYGRGALWNACHGTSLGPFWLLIGPEAIMPLTYVENCAEAIVAAVESQDAIGSTLNIVDDDLPTRKAYTEALVQASQGAPKVMPVSWPFLRSASGGLWKLNQALFAGQLKLPGLLVPARLDARFKPLTYSNQLAKQILGWEPRYSWEEALNRCFAHENGVDV